MFDRRAFLRPPNTGLTIAALAVLISGLIYYALWRPSSSALIDYSAGSYPSLVHMLSLTWLCFALGGMRQGLSISTLLLFTSLLAEALIGFFSLTDVLMLVMGFAIGTATAARYLQKKSILPYNRALTAGLTLSLCSVFIAGSSPLFPCILCPLEDPNARPVYMDYQTLRNAVTMSGPRTLSDTSRVYVYQSYVFLNNKNNGIHVIDNSVPTTPTNIAFIEIPGNTELSIRSNYLYADSYIDLITLDISDPANVREVDRVQEIFPYDAYQNIPDDIYFNYNELDQNRGVVISYELID